MPASYNVKVEGLTFGDTYRIHVVTLNGVNRYSNTATCSRSNDTAGCVVVVDGEEYYMGGNIITNGEFDNGLEGWYDGTGASAAAPGFQAVPFGGNEGDSDAYLQCWMHTGATGNGWWRYGTLSQ